MKDWRYVMGSQKDRPEEMDMKSSPTTVYLRKNIEKVEQKGRDGEIITSWTYEEKEMTVEEYRQMMLMKQVAKEEAIEIIKTVTEYQKEQTIDEYTMQLVEEGIL